MECTFDNMQARNLAPHTQPSYLCQVSQFTCHFGKSPELLAPDDIRAYRLSLVQERRPPTGSSLTPNAVDGQRMVMRVKAGKGRKDRYVMPTRSAASPA
jgi:hypothetical protein